MQTIIYIIVILGVIYFITGSEEVGNCLGGLIKLAIIFAIIAGAFAINPIFGIIVGYLLLKGLDKG